MQDAELATKPKASISAIEAGCEFLRKYWLRNAAISAVLLIPCFWHRHLEAGDLPTHVYNAWLAQLIVKGQAPGLYLARQWNNVLFDFALSGLGNLVGLAAAEKMAVSAAVLIFFWGAFALACSISHTGSPKSIPWFLAPCLAVFAYGYTFEMGFMNYYISIGLAFFGLAVLARSDGRPSGSLVPDILAVCLLIPLIWLAHPLGLCVLAGAGIYIVAAKYLPPARHVYLLSETILILLVLHLYIRVRQWDVLGSFIHRPAGANFRLLANGADQLLLYAPHYLLPVYLIMVLFVVSLLVDALRKWGMPQWKEPYLLPVQLYILALLAVRMLPATIQVPHRFGAMVPLGFITDRLTSVVAIFGCCILAQIKPRKWHYACFAALAAIFFSYLYSDTAKISNMEDQTDRLVASLPRGQRVTRKVLVLPGNRITINGIIPRACIGQCFEYDDYEPSTDQFRVRVRSENPFVMKSGADIAAVLKGDYVVKQADLPLSAIYQCEEGGTAICLSKLVAGQENGSVGAPQTEPAKLPK